MLDDALAIARAGDDDLLCLRRRTESAMQDAPAREAAMRRARDMGTLMERFEAEATAALARDGASVPKNVVFPDASGWTTTIVDGKPTASFRATLERLRDVLEEAERDARAVEEDPANEDSSYSDYSDSDTQSSRSSDGESDDASDVESEVESDGNETDETE